MIFYSVVSLLFVCSKIPQYVHGEKKKTKAVPDFGKLHERWQKKLEEGKVCQKKPQTMVVLLFFSFFFSSPIEISNCKYFYINAPKQCIQIH